MASRSGRARGGVALVVTALAIACGSGRPAPAAVDRGPDAGPAPAPTDGGADDGSVIPDANPETDGSATDGSVIDGGTCNSLVAGGGLVGQTLVPGKPPVPIGGPIDDEATFVLVERDYYPDVAEVTGAPSGEEDLVVQRTMATHAETLEVVEGQGPVGVESVTRSSTTATFTVTDKVVLTTNVTCPAPPHAANVRFSVMGSELWLFRTAAQREVYAEEP